MAAHRMGAIPIPNFRRVEKRLSRQAHNLEIGGSTPPPAIGRANCLNKQR